MATALVDIGTGSTVKFSGVMASFDSSTTTHQLLSVAFTGASRPALKTTHMLTAKAINTIKTYGGDTFLMGDFADPGQLDVEYNFSPDDWSVDAPLAQDFVTITVTITDGAGNAEWTMSGAMMSHEFTIPIEDVMTCSASFKLSGLVTMALGA